MVGSEKPQTETEATITEFEMCQTKNGAVVATRKKFEPIQGTAVPNPQNLNFVQEQESHLYDP